MLDSFIVVGTQVLTLFILIGIGFACGRLKFLNKDGVKCINDIVIYIVNPCLIVSAFQRKFEAALLHNFLYAILGALIAHVLCLLIARFYGLLRSSPIAGSWGSLFYRLFWAPTEYSTERHIWWCSI